MAEHEKKTTSGTQDVDEIRRKKKSPEPMVEKLKAQAGEPNPYAAILETAMDEPSPEKHAALLGDPRFSHPVNNSQKAGLVTELQQNYGNAYVQRVVNHIQTKRDNRVSGNQHDIADIERRIVAQKGLGQPFATETRFEMEDVFGQDFGDVHIHADARADKLARELDAKAFTTGKDVFFREGAYQPNSEAGKGLLAHELTHVVQQCRTLKIGEGLISQGGDASEMEARASELRVGTGRQATVEQSLEQAAIQRQVLPTVGKPVTTVTFSEEEVGVIEGSLEPRKKFLSSMKIAVWPEPKGGNIDWLVDPMRIFLTPYSDEVNPGISFSTSFVISPEAHLDRSGTSPTKEWPRTGKLGCKYDFFLKGANDFDLDIELRFGGLDPKECPPVTRKVHVTDKRPTKGPELPTKIGETMVATKYKVVKGQLFIKGPQKKAEISPEDIDQEFLGTCYFLSSLAAVAKDHPEIIKKMIKDNKNGTYTVTFYEDTSWFGKPEYKAVKITVDSKLPFLAAGGQEIHLSAQPADFSAAGAELWVAIVEKAYAQWKGGYPDIEGGYPVKALPEITGVEAKEYSASDYSNKDLLDKLSTALAMKHPVTASAYGSNKEEFFDFVLKLIGEKAIVEEIKQARERLDVYYAHAYTIMAVKDDSIQLRNPWGTNHPQLWVGNFRLWFKTFTISSL